MTPARMIVALVVSFGLSACAVDTIVLGAGETKAGPAHTASGATPTTVVKAKPAKVKGPVALVPQYTVSSITVVVPSELVVSEANTYLPKADIVWRGEPRGDRKEQVLAIFEEAMARGTTGMTSGPAVVVEVVVTRFHCLTEKTRATVGGNHSLRFDLTVRDAATGEIIDGPRAVVADVKASGGAAAIAEDQAGLTQRVVVVDRLAEVIKRELSAQVTGPQAEALLPDLTGTLVPGQVDAGL